MVWGDLSDLRSNVVKPILGMLIYIAAGAYLLVDAIFMTLAKPIADWIDKHVPMRRLGTGSDPCRRTPLWLCFQCR